jgi:hypothetical protein
VLTDLRAAIEDTRKEVIGHPLYRRLTDEAAVVTFTEHHVWAVWDFMSLLKALQRRLTCVEVPWVPVGPPSTRRLVNEIVLAEESDELVPGGELGARHASHFELYLLAMAQAGADTGPVTRFVDLIRDGRPVIRALADAPAPFPAAQFVASTWGAAQSPHVWGQAAAFAFGREDLIPEMFSQVSAISSPRLGLFADYLARHVELDELHGAMATAMVEQLCGDDGRRWAEATQAAEVALWARARLWTGTLAAIETAPR